MFTTLQTSRYKLIVDYSRMFREARKLRRQGASVNFTEYFLNEFQKYGSFDLHIHYVLIAAPFWRYIFIIIIIKIDL